VEFQKIIPMLTTPRPGKDFVFEVIAPSLPGYGFSQGAVRSGLASAQVKLISRNINTFIQRCYHKKNRYRSQHLQYV